MIFLCFFFLACFNVIHADQQYYDPSSCSKNGSFPGSRYICKSHQSSCLTFLVYRANRQFQTISDISQLLQVDPDELLELNNLTLRSEKFNPGREVVVPVTCSCTGKFFQVKFSYRVTENMTFQQVACDVFEGLVKLQTLVEENKGQETDVKVDTELSVPLKCACPDSQGLEYLVTYPLLEGDELNVLVRKFNISHVDLWTANKFVPSQTIYPSTTVLIPLKSRPVIDFCLPNSPPPAPQFLPTITVEHADNKKVRNLYIVASVVGFFLLVAALVAVGLYVKAFFRGMFEKLQSFNTRSSPLSCSTTARSSPRSGETGKSSRTCLSPDLLAEIKYSLKNYNIEDIKKSTNDFNEKHKIGDQAFKGLIENSEIMIKQMRFEETRQVIDVHSKINHKNILYLTGVCYGENDFSWSYLVFEFPANGCLRDCLLNQFSPLRWLKRTQIAFDVATALHYLHYCIFPSQAHMNVNSRNIFITSAWRAKLTNIGGNANSESIERLIAAECGISGSASEKADIFAFGVVLLELISGRVDTDNGKSLKDCIAFISGGTNEGGCLEQLKGFMDPCLKDDYSLAEALCLAVLAKACAEDDPLHRPSMDDILKVLVRMI